MSISFNWKQYISNYPDLVQGGIDTREKALIHFNKHGKNEGRNDKVAIAQEKVLNIYLNNFNWKQYILNYPDLVEGGIDTQKKAIIHFNKYGRNEGRNDKVAIAQEKVLNIYLNNFDWKQYISNYPDLVEGGIDTEEKAIIHFNKYGRNEGRTYVFNKKILNNVRNYSIKGYSDLLLDISNGIIKYTQKGIPKIIFKSSFHKRNEMHEEIIKVLEITKNLNKDYQIYYFDDTEVERSINDISKRLHIAYKNIIPSAFKSDFWRYCMLYKFGGCYSDIGHIMMVSFNEICGNKELILVNELHNGGIHNALMCCCKKEKLMDDAKNLCLKNIENRYYGERDIDVTGPYMLGRLYKIYPYKYKVKMLEHFIDYNKINVEQIKDNNKVLIHTKFNNYYNIMYNNKLRYTELWNKKNIYNNINE
jgi:mannosyltransferase OCH1-like enzyme